MYRPKIGKRNGNPAITVPRTLTQSTYFNVPLVKYLEERGIAKMNFEVTEDNEIIIRKTREGQKGYKVLATGLRGHGVSPRLRKMLPAGRYEIVDKRRMKFAKA